MKDDSDQENDHPDEINNIFHCIFLTSQLNFRQTLGRPEPLTV